MKYPSVSAAALLSSFRHVDSIRPAWKQAVGIHYFGDGDSLGGGSPPPRELSVSFPAHFMKEIAYFGGECSRHWSRARLS